VGRPRIDAEQRASLACTDKQGGRRTGQVGHERHPFLHQAIFPRRRHTVATIRTVTDEQSITN